MNSNMPNDLTQTITTIVLYYIKKQYHKYLTNNNIQIIQEENIKEVVNNFYVEKEQDLKKFIRNTMRKNFPDYDVNLTMKTITEEIILEMFDDMEFSIEKITLEISNYQKGLKSS
tara:strand:- start:948 stop:1292 length:345 start_codon:yes stop_codon:yes gene_type:complete